MFQTRILQDGGIDPPYEKCIKRGPASLTDTELLAVILRTGTRGCSALDLSAKILSDGGGPKGLLRLFHVGAEELKQIPGIGTVKAIQLLCIGELSRRLARKKAEERISFSDPATIADCYMETLRHREQEHIYGLFLDTRNHLLAERQLFVGTVNASMLSPREVFVEALRMRAVRLILLHNHPSGDPTPSPQDKEITKRIRKAGSILDIACLDHIIIGDCCYYSFREHGLL